MFREQSKRRSKWLSQNSTCCVTSQHARRVARIMTSVSSRACLNMADDEEAVVFACKSSVFCALDLHLSQEQLLEKVRWTCPPQSTLWRPHWTRVMRFARRAVLSDKRHTARHDFFLCRNARARWSVVLWRDATSGIWALHSNRNGCRKKHRRTDSGHIRWMPLGHFRRQFRAEVPRCPVPPSRHHPRRSVSRTPLRAVPSSPDPDASNCRSTNQCTASETTATTYDSGGTADSRNRKKNTNRKINATIIKYFQNQQQTHRVSLLHSRVAQN